MDIDHTGMNINDNMDIDNNVRVQAMRSGKMQTSSIATRRQTSSSATRHDHDTPQMRRLNDCIHKYIDEHNMVTETIGPGRIAELIKACFTTCSSPLQESELLSAVRNPGIKNKHAKRQGAKAVKKLFQRTHISGDLNPAEATGFRALSARAN